MNRTTVIGNLGADAEVRHLESGQSAITFSVGTTERWTDKQGNKQERTDWTRCTIWKPADKTAIAQYLKKGTKVLVEGKATARGWIHQTTGEVNAQIELTVSNIELLSALAQTSAPAPQASAPMNPAATPGTYTTQGNAGTAPMSTSDKIAASNAGQMQNAEDEDLPF